MKSEALSETDRTVRGLVVAMLDRIRPAIVEHVATAIAEYGAERSAQRAQLRGAITSLTARINSGGKPK